jgi:hypothetical protein
MKHGRVKKVAAIAAMPVVEDSVVAVVGQAAVVAAPVGAVAGPAVAVEDTVVVVVVVAAAAGDAATASISLMSYPANSFWTVFDRIEPVCARIFAGPAHGVLMHKRSSVVVPTTRFSA